MSHIPVSIILRGRRPTGAVCITSSWGVKIDGFVSTAVLHTFHSLKGVDWFIGPSWHLPTSLGRWGGQHVFAVSSCRRLGEPRKLWILCLKVWIVKACFKQCFTCQELSLLEGRVGHIKRILPGAAAGCLSFWHHWVPLQLFASCPH